MLPLWLDQADCYRRTMGDAGVPVQPDGQPTPQLQAHADVSVKGRAAAASYRPQANALGQPGEALPPLQQLHHRTSGVDGAVVVGVSCV